jgi:O-antigen/teichoic acid export membrane protein
LLNGLVTVGASIILVVLMTARFGLIGAAIATTAAEAIGLVFGIWLTRYSFKLPWVPLRLLRICLCLLAMAIGFLIGENFKPDNEFLHLFVVLVIASITYGAAAFCLDVAGVRTYLMKKLPLVRSLRRRST